MATAAEERSSRCHELSTSASELRFSGGKVLGLLMDPERDGAAKPPRSKSGSWLDSFLYWKL
jgi:hypothetical protein